MVEAVVSALASDKLIQVADFEFGAVFKFPADSNERSVLGKAAGLAKVSNVEIHKGFVPSDKTERTSFVNRIVQFDELSESPPSIAASFYKTLLQTRTGY